MANTRIRMTIAGHIYYQIPGSNAIHVPLMYDRGVLTPEQPYNRSPRLGVAEEWTQLDLGWLSECSGMIVLKNLEQPLGTYPQEGDKVLEYGYGHRDAHDDKPHFKIYPGETQPITPSHPDQVYIRCKNGPAKYSITVFPR